MHFFKVWKIQIYHICESMSVWYIFIEPVDNVLEYGEKSTLYCKY